MFALAVLPTESSILLKRWPSVVTMRTRFPSHSNSALFRCRRVSSVEIEKWVPAIRSESASTGSDSMGELLSGSGNAGNSSPGMPCSV